MPAPAPLPRGHRESRELGASGHRQGWHSVCGSDVEGKIKGFLKEKVTRTAEAALGGLMEKSSAIPGLPTHSVL